METVGDLYYLNEQKLLNWFRISAIVLASLVGRNRLIDFESPC